jgi:hypothetical protein
MVIKALELNKEIETIIYDFRKNECIRVFFHKLRSLKDDIRISISEELFKKFDVEYKCVYYEHLYGDNDADTLHVVNDCIEVLNAIITTGPSVC